MQVNLIVNNKDNTMVVSFLDYKLEFTLVKEKIEDNFGNRAYPFKLTSSVKGSEDIILDLDLEDDTTMSWINGVSSINDSFTLYGIRHKYLYTYEKYLPVFVNIVRRKFLGVRWWGPINAEIRPFQDTFMDVAKYCVKATDNYAKGEVDFNSFLAVAADEITQQKNGIELKVTTIN